ncbi:translesion error-prone DNA polymerase V autoproteolytic subunit [Candidatus Kaiserbacteria bacterium]|nr:translesion error-prone DNA polymerase V autoproteolytic subunit [Candidatus Kaiserbacteria bacterium]
MGTKRPRSNVAAVAGGEQSHPLLFASQPAAGFPAPGDDLVEQPLDLNDLLVEHPTSTFFVRVSGDSMEGVGIFDRDILVVDRSIVPTDGKIVVAAVYGELVVKRLGKYDGKQALLSANDGYAPIVVAESDDVFVWGVVTGSVRFF